ncbi:hypothetical protein [Chitinimonas lacunae]|uniref:Transposase n=1 Tax=Chitinimonas lacunae TaxID=1963018 RepID=A0ABV8MP69_9NEIS
MYSIPNYRNRPTRTLQDRLRTLFKVRVNRSLPEPGLRPNVGDFIALNGLAMRITEPMRDELWDWLTFARWRQIYPKRDRRNYRYLPSDSFRRLARCTSDERSAVMNHLLRHHEESPAG